MNSPNERLATHLLALAAAAGLVALDPSPADAAPTCYPLASARIEFQVDGSSLRLRASDNRWTSISDSTRSVGVGSTDMVELCFDIPPEQAVKMTFRDGSSTTLYRPWGGGMRCFERDRDEDPMNVSIESGNLGTWLALPPAPAPAPAKTSATIKVKTTCPP